MADFKILPKNTNVAGTKFIKEYHFACGHIAPIFEAETMQGLTQILGKAKFINRDFGNVLYRGECSLHEGLIPSVFRGRSNCASAIRSTKIIHNRIVGDEQLPNFIKISSQRNARNHKIEGILQHYGIKTRYIDVVDNHWIALWMGLFKCQQYAIEGKYFHYCKREVPLIEHLQNVNIDSRDLYQYILLIALPFAQRNEDGILEDDNFLQIDLRQILPSTFLRPHAQHGFVIRKKAHGAETPQDYDMASQVVGIIQIRIDRADKWIGNGELLTQENLFPAPAYDTGYDVLLHRNDIFENTGQSIAIYV